MRPRLRRTAAPSIARRLTLRLGAIALAGFALAGLLLDFALLQELRRQEREDLRGKLEMTRHFFVEVGGTDNLDEFRHRLTDMLLGHPELRVWATAADGSAIFGESSPVVVGNDDGMLRLRRADGVPLRGVMGPASDGRASDLQLLVAVDARPRAALIARHRVVLALLCILGTALVGGLGAWVARSGLAPVKSLSMQAARITPGGLSTRLPVTGTPRELQDLAQAFNVVLERLQGAYEQLEGFNADVAHELRTPLATMISGTQVALSSERSNDELRETLAANLEVLEELKRLVNDMLFLARADRGEAAPDLVRVSLADEVRQVIEFFDATLEDRAIRVEVSGDAHVRSNAALVRRAISNLLSNALAFTAPGGAVKLVIGSEPGFARLAVKNSGVTIAPRELPRIFDRFFRGNGESRSGSESHGLGLAIVKAIARMHGGQVFAASGDGITEVGFTLADRG